MMFQQVEGFEPNRKVGSSQGTPGVAADTLITVPSCSDSSPECPEEAIDGKIVSLCEKMIAAAPPKPRARFAVIGERTFAHQQALMKEGCDPVQVPLGWKSHRRKSANLVWIVDLTQRYELTTAIRSASRLLKSTGRLVLDATALREGGQLSFVLFCIASMGLCVTAMIGSGNHILLVAVPA